MLAALSITEPRRRLLGIRRRKTSVTSEFVTAGSGRYLRINAEKGHNGQLNWNLIQQAAGRETGRLLLPRGLNPPENSRILPFEGHALAWEMMRKTGLALLKLLAINPRLVKVSIIDPQAVLPDMTLEFFPYASDVVVVTNRPDRYTRQQYESMKRFGAVLVVTPDMGSLSGSLLILAPNGISDRGIPFTGRELILSGIKGDSLPVNLREPEAKKAKGLIDGYMPHVPHSLLGAMPPGCDSGLFLAGLYELSGVKEIALQPPEFLHLAGPTNHPDSGKTITFKDAALKLAGIDIGISV